MTRLHVIKVYHERRSRLLSRINTEYAHYLHTAFRTMLLRMYIDFKMACKEWILLSSGKNRLFNDDKQWLFIKKNFFFQVLSVFLLFICWQVIVVYKTPDHRDNILLSTPTHPFVTLKLPPHILYTETQTCHPAFHLTDATTCFMTR